MPPCVHHRFSRLPIARIHLSHRSPELISAFASVRPSARSLHDDSCTLPTIPFLLSLPSRTHRVLPLFLSSRRTADTLPATTLPPRSRRPSPPLRFCIFDRRYDSTRETRRGSRREGGRPRGPLRSDAAIRVRRLLDMPVDIPTGGILYLKAPLLL